MKLSVLIFFFLILTQTYSQISSKSFYFPEVGWTITVPNNIEVQSIAQFDTMVSNLEKKINYKFDSGVVRALCLLKSGKLEKLKATISMADTILFKTFEESSQYGINGLFSIFKDRVTIVDTSTSLKKIDGVLFRKIVFLVKYPQYTNVQTTVFYYTWRNGYEFEIGIMYEDLEKGKELINIAESSKFGN